MHALSLRRVKFLLFFFGVLVITALVLYLFLPRTTVYAPVIPEESQDHAFEDDERDEQNISLAYIEAGDTIPFPFVLSGHARVFENVVEYRLIDDMGNVLDEGYTVADAPDVGMFGPFTATFYFDAPQHAQGVLEVFSSSPRDGAPENIIRVPVRFDQSAMQASYVDVYFLPQSSSDDCGQVLPLRRRIPQTPAVAHEALQALLRGVRASERSSFLTALPQQAALRSIFIENGVATVTFAEGSFSGVAGSCLVQSIRAQIEATLAQFSSISSVVLLEEGKSFEETLQP